MSALIALLFVTLMPTILGHAGLATTDIAATSLCLSGLYAFTLWLEDPNYRNCLIFGLTWGLAASAKFSPLLFLPVSAIATLFWSLLLAKKSEYRPNLPSITGQIRPMLLTLIIAALVAFVVIWSCYRFSIQSNATPKDEIHSAIDRMLGDKGKLKDMAYLIADSPVFPLKDFFIGIWYQMKHNERGHKTYLLGEYSTHGWWYFFPVVFLIKTPLGFLVFAAIGSIVSAIKSIRMKRWQFFVPLLSATAIMISVMPANLNLGVRYILIVYPLLAIVGGYGAAYLLKLQKLRIIGRVIFVIFLTWFIFSSSFSHPDYIAYFNELAARSPERFRNDSDLDWGQDLKRLSIELKHRNVKKLKLAYFGSADPEKFNLPPFTTLNRHQTTTGWIAISVCKLKDVYGTPPHDGFAWLEKYKPLATIGKSIKLYNIKTDN
jgi:4-amino-4-deoxy-L-arabinose transferase-like glycosyltransferase